MTVSAGGLQHAVPGPPADRRCAVLSAGGLQITAAVRWWTVRGRWESPVWFGQCAVGRWWPAVSDFRSAG